MTNIATTLRAALATPRTTTAQRSGDHVNREGAPSYLRSIQEQVLAVLTTGTLNDTFYASREKIAKDVGESRGILAASFSRSASHVLRGAAVIVEGLGWILPYALVLVGLAVPLAVACKFRRRGARVDSAGGVK